MYCTSFCGSLNFLVSESYFRFIFLTISLLRIVAELKLRHFWNPKCLDFTLIIIIKKEKEKRIFLQKQRFECRYICTHLKKE